MTWTTLVACAASLFVNLIHSFEENYTAWHSNATDIANTTVVGVELTTEAVFQYNVAVTKFPCVDSAKCSFTVNNTGADEKAPEGLGEKPAQHCLIKGQLHYSKNWYGYLATFRLRAANALLYYKFEYPEENCCVKMLLYLEEQKNMLRHRMNCLQKEAIAGTGAQVILLSPAHQESGCHSNSSSENREIQCSSGRELRSKVDRDWFIAVSSCGSPTGLQLKYVIQAYGHIGQCPTKKGKNSAVRLVRANLLVILCLVLASFGDYLLL